MQITTSYHSTAVHPSQAIYSLSPQCCTDDSVSILTYLTVQERTVLTVFLNRKLVFSRTVIRKVMWYKYLNCDGETHHHLHPLLLWTICGFKLTRYVFPRTIISNSTFIFVTTMSVTCIRSCPLARSYFTYSGLSTCWRNILPVNLPFWLK